MGSDQVGNGKNEAGRARPERGVRIIKMKFFEQARLLKVLRVYHGGTQSEMAKHLAIQMTRWHGLESGQSELKLSEIKKLHDAFPVFHDKLVALSRGEEIVFY